MIGLLQRVSHAEVMVGNPRRYSLLLQKVGALTCTIAGVNRSYPNAVRDAMQIIGVVDNTFTAAVHLMVFKDRTMVLADTSLNIEPSSDQLADIAIAAADSARAFGLRPRVAMLSFSNFGSVPHPSARRVQAAVALVRERRPDLLIEGEMHADVAVDRAVGSRHYPHSLIDGDANVLVFPELGSGNISYKLLEHLAGAEAIGPILVGLKQPVVVSYQAATPQTLVRLASIAVAGTLETSQG